MRRLGFLASVALGASVLPLASGTTAPAEAASDDIIAVVIEGVGSGHGRGMSQWGAYGWAVDEAKNWDWIVDHYYGGTEAGTVDAAERIRVRLLGHDGSTSVGVTSHGPGVTWGGATTASMYAEEVAPDTFDVYSADTVTCPGAATLTVPDGPLVYSPPPTFNADVQRMQQFLDVFHDSAIGVDGYFGPQTRSILIDWQTSESLNADGVWDLDDAGRARAIIAAGSGGAAWTKVGSAVAGPIVFTAPNGETSSAAPGDVLGLCRSGGSVTHYRGAIELWNTSSGNRVVNDVKVEDYLRGVVPKEISASWANSGGGAGANAVRSQAVAARSYGLQQARYSYAGTCDSTSCQVYGGAASRSTAAGSSSSIEDSRTDAAIAATVGVVRRWPAGHAKAGQIVATEFSASNGPRTAGGVFTPVDDAPGDGTDKNPNHRWTRILDADTLAAQYGLGQLTGAEMVEAASSTYQQFDGIWFNDILLTGTNGSFRQQAWDFRGAQGLKSPGFTVRVITEDTSSMSIGMIGDSVGASILGGGSSELDRLIDGTFASTSIDVVSGRCTTNIFCNGSTGVEAASNLPFGLDLVVVELGYNDWPAGFDDDIDDMMAALNSRGVGQVAWVNMADIRTTSGGQSFYGPSNQALETATARWPNLTILDWDAASDNTERPRWFSDGVHLTTSGQAEFALWLRDLMVSPDPVAPSYWLVPPKKILLPVVGETLTSPAGGSMTVPADAQAVALNITGVGPVAPGYATVWPCASPQPDTSNLNFVAGDVVANSVIAPVGPDGTVCFYSSAGTDFLVDVAGWFPDDAAATFEPITPRRVVDTRNGVGAPTGPVSSASPLIVRLGGVSVPQPAGGSVTIPADAAAVAVNLTAVGTAAAGFATVWPCSSPRPDASHLNFGANDTVPNTVVAPLDEHGEFCVFMDKPGHVLVDVAGWFPASAPGTGFQSAVPRRIVDTRQSAKVQPSSPLVVPIHGATFVTEAGPAAVPSSATAVAINLTIVGADGPGFATVWPCSASRPDASNANYVPDVDVANGVIAPIGADGTICVYTYAAAHVLVDVNGWFSGGTDPSFVGSVPRRLVDTRNAIGPPPS